MRSADAAKQLLRDPRLRLRTRTHVGAGANAILRGSREQRVEGRVDRRRAARDLGRRCCCKALHSRVRAGSAQRERATLFTRTPLRLLHRARPTTIPRARRSSPTDAFALPTQRLSWLLTAAARSSRASVVSLRFGIDLGGTKIELIALEAGAVRLQRRVPTPAHDYDAILDCIAEHRRRRARTGRSR
jgi:hypothetical protein